jgi:hypothetical protein
VPEPICLAIAFVLARSACGIFGFDGAETDAAVLQAERVLPPHLELALTLATVVRLTALSTFFSALVRLS